MEMTEVLMDAGFWTVTGFLFAVPVIIVSNMF